MATVDKHLISERLRPEHKMARRLPEDRQSRRHAFRSSPLAVTSPLQNAPNEANKFIVFTDVGFRINPAIAARDP